MTITALLLGDPSPSLRWRAARELDGAPDDDAEVIAWRAEIDRSPEVAVLIEHLAAADTQPSVAGYLLCRLAHLGYRGPATEAAVEKLFALQQPDGSWSTPGPTEGARFITMHTVIPLRGLAAAGFATDPRAERAYEWLLSVRLPDGSWPSGPKTDPGTPTAPEKPYRRLPRGLGCRSATTGAAACLALHPERRRSDTARIAVEHLLDSSASNLGWETSRLLGLEPAMGQITFYVTPDPAFLLDLASRCGVSPQDLTAQLEAQRGPYGLWQHPSHPQLSGWLSLSLESSLRRLSGG